MFRQSLIQVFKGLAEFHSYVPVAPATQTEPGKTTAVSQSGKAVCSFSSKAICDCQLLLITSS